MASDKKGFYTTWRLLSWNDHSTVLELFTKRPKNRLLNEKHHWTLNMRFDPI